MKTFIFMALILLIALIVGAVVFLSCYWIGIRPPYLGAIVSPFVVVTTMLAAHVLGGKFR